ncbi:unnamed protein product [Effrenium voratum]|uniref:Uncharacterized protein n=1 Tax=Effrenium voratum TaxID=2562239 RepID=A0AA36HTW4_9DINO|nr:unnamed protein product [Effrenium voratum]CAJ1430244.1 unnamed protein product [Effrenium voratum]
MLEELSVMDAQAQPFVEWLEKEKASLLARRRKPKPKQPEASEPDKPPGQFSPKVAASQEAGAGVVITKRLTLQPNSVTASLVESAKAGAGVVITKRLTLQPNTGQWPVESPLDPERVAADKKAEEAHQKKLELLAEMTQKLQVILQRLSDKNLSDASRERYQGMAQTIQSRMASLSQHPAEKAEAPESAVEVEGA